LEYNLILLKSEGAFLKLTVILAFLRSSRGFPKIHERWLVQMLFVTSLKLLDCENGGFQQLARNLCAQEIN
jgi:hypothetical protein